MSTPTHRDMFADVFDFHRLGCPETTGSLPAVPAPHLVELRIKFIEEEAAELSAALRAGDLPEVADGIGDLIYVLIGLAITCGIDIRPVWGAIHQANLDKVNGRYGPPSRREDGKTSKPPGWVAPDIFKVLLEQKPLEPTPRGDGGFGSTDRKENR